jgi:hypothetical protein
MLTNDSHKIIFQSSVRSALKPCETNLRLEPHEGESPPKPINFIKSRRTEDGNSYALHTLPGFTPDNLIGRTFLTDTQDNGERFRARIARKFLMLTNHMTSNFSLKSMTVNTTKSSPTTKF